MCSEPYSCPKYFTKILRFNSGKKTQTAVLEQRYPTEKPFSHLPAPVTQG